MKSRLAIVSIPTAGHVKTLIRMCQSLKQHRDAHITFILTGWESYRMSQVDQDALRHAADEVIALAAGSDVDRRDIFARSVQLTDDVIAACAGHDHIFYDFMTPEGYIAACRLSLPMTCVNPSFIGVFDPDDNEFKKQMCASRSNIEILEQKYQLSLLPSAQFISNQIVIQAPENIVFSWSGLILSEGFMKHREQYQYRFMRPGQDNQTLTGFEYAASARALGKKIIYFSLGTIAPGAAWDSVNNSLHAFIKSLYQSLFTIAARRDDLLLICAAGRNPHDISDGVKLPTNVHLYNFVPQPQLLPHVDLFITHCGGNSTNEAIDSEVPMIGIPFMFDQHECAERIAELGIGISFQHKKEDRARAAYLDSDLYFREGLSEESLEAAIDDVLDTEDYRKNIITLKTKEPATKYFEAI